MNRFALLLVPLLCIPAFAGIGDPQIKTDHPWYPGELSCSTFERLFKTQAELYKRVTGREVTSDEDKALASWYWRNLNYFHAEDGGTDCFNTGFTKSDKNREYWTGLFAHGFSLCGSTHAQWSGEMEVLLGHGRSRVMGVQGHNTFEVWLTGGAYGEGRWALLDHDISTVIFAEDGSRLLGLKEVVDNYKTLADPKFKPERQRGWYVSGLEDNDARGVYRQFITAEYLCGYSAVPPMVHLRNGETLRRYAQPGLEDGKTFVFWGRNYNAGKIAGPERTRTWVNQPDKMYKSTTGSKHIAGQARYGNAAYTYTPDFASGSYKQAVVEEAADHVTFEFYTPYVIGGTPAKEGSWGVYEAGATNGLVLNGSAACKVEVSTDQGKTWQSADFKDGLDLTDHVKGHQQYLLKFNASADALKSAKLSWRTVCQCNASLIPRLKEGPNQVTFASSGQGYVSAGPNLDQIKVVDGEIGKGKTVTIELATPRGVTPARLYAASWNSSSNPPPGDVVWQIDYSADGGKTWESVVKEWKIVRHEPDPTDFWSQSFCFGNVALKDSAGGAGGPLRVRFSNNGGKSFRKVEAHLAYQVPQQTPVDVTIAWKEGDGATKTASHTYQPTDGKEDTAWTVTAGANPRVVSVEYVAK